MYYFFLSKQVCRQKLLNGKCGNQEKYASVLAVINMNKNKVSDHLKLQGSALLMFHNLAFNIQISHHFPDLNE